MSYSWDHTVESYRTYLSRKDYLGEITGAMGRASSEIQGSIDAQTRSVIGSNEAIAQTLSSDIGALSGEVSAGFSQMAGAFNWGFSEMLASLGGMGDSIKELVAIAKTPAQTAAYEPFEIARENHRKGLLEECLDELGKAIDGDHVSSGYKTEWRFHQLRGIVRLGSFKNADPSVMDAAKAEESFLLAARYAKADTPKEAARALLSAGFAAYVQSHDEREKLRDALAHTEAALKLDGGLSEAMFQASKVRMALGETAAALPALRQAIEADAGYVVRAAEDPDHRRHTDEVRRFFEAVRAEKQAAVAQKARRRSGSTSARSSGRRKSGRSRPPTGCKPWQRRRDT